MVEISPVSEITGPIPAPWKDTVVQYEREGQQHQDQQEHQQQHQVSTPSGVKAGNKRGNKSDGQVQQKSAKRAKCQPAAQQQEADADNSCSDDDTINISSPGIPMANSTPLAAGAAARSAFAILQPPSMGQHQVPVPPPQMPPHFAPPGGYFYPPPPTSAMDPAHQQQMYHHHQQHPYPFMPWPRSGLPPMGYPHGPGGFMMPKMESLDMGAEYQQMFDMVRFGGEHSTGKIGQQKRKKPVAKKITTLEKVLNGLDENNEPKLNNSTNLPSPDNTFASGNNTLAVLTPPVPLAMHHPIAGYETYCTVPGRLTLLSNLKKYRVSIAEIQRRLAPPECLNASILGGILRKAKNKDGGRLLREQLQTYGVELTSGRRKQGPLTCFSSLVEEEAAQIAYDFNMINQKHYPSKEAAAFGLCEVQNAQDASMCRMELYYAGKFLNRMLDFHRADQSPIAAHIKQEENLMPSSAELSTELQRGLTNYSLLTHGFGPRVVQSVLDSMLNVVNESNNVLNSNYQQQPGTSTQQMMGVPPMNF